MGKCSEVGIGEWNYS